MPQRAWLGRVAGCKGHTTAVGTKCAQNPLGYANLRAKRGPGDGAATKKTRGAIRDLESTVAAIAPRRADAAPPDAEGRRKAADGATPTPPVRRRHADRLERARAPG